MIPDPADRLTGEFLDALDDRYAGQTEPIVIPFEDYAVRFGNLCDLAVQLLWPEAYGTDPTDPAQHTSDPARQVARAIMHATGIFHDQEHSTTPAD